VSFPWKKVRLFPVTVQILRENERTSQNLTSIPLCVVFLLSVYYITVMKDLRVLEQQQHESQRKLQHAQETKQRRLEYHAALEAKLEQLKYQNGQNRAELSHMRNLLSKGQRSLGTARLAAGRAGDDLRDFDRKLKQALASKRATLAHQHRQERILAEFSNKIALVWRLKDEAEEHVDKGKMEISQHREREEALRQEVRAEVAKQQTLDRETAKARHETRLLEQELKQKQECEILTKARIESINKDSVSEDQRHSDTMASMKAKLDSYGSSSKETQAAIVRMDDQIAKKKEIRNKAWYRTIRIQQAEGHPPSLPPTESNTPPDFDMARLQEAVAVETKAAADEVTAKEELHAAVTALELDLAKAEKEAQAKAQERLDLEKSNEEAKLVEAERCERDSKFLKDLENLEEEKTALESTLNELREQRANEMGRVQEESLQLERQILALQTALVDNKKQLSSLTSSIETTKADYEKAKVDDDTKLQAVQAQVQAAKETYEEAKETATRVIEDCFDEDCDGIENACKILNEDSIAEHARILEGKTLYDHCHDPTRNIHSRFFVPR
jgi:chromosome segregation ATPase